MEDDEIRLSVAAAAAESRSKRVRPNIERKRLFKNNNSCFSCTVATTCGHGCRAIKKKKGRRSHKWQGGPNLTQPYEATRSDRITDE